MYFLEKRGWTINYGSGDVTTLSAIPVRHLPIASRNSSGEESPVDDEMKEIFAAELPVSLSSSASTRLAGTNEGSITVPQMVHYCDTNRRAGRCLLSDEADDEAEPERLLHHYNHKDDDKGGKKRSRSVFSISTSSDPFGIDLIGSSSGGSDRGINTNTQQNVRLFPPKLSSTEVHSKNNILRYRRSGASVEIRPKWRHQTKIRSMNNLTTAMPSSQVNGDSMSLPALGGLSASSKNLTSSVELSFTILRQRIVDLEIQYVSFCFKFI